jgi:hypothetical protein
MLYRAVFLIALSTVSSAYAQNYSPDSRIKGGQVALTNKINTFTKQNLHTAIETFSAGQITGNITGTGALTIGSANGTNLILNTNASIQFESSAINILTLQTGTTFVFSPNAYASGAALHYAFNSSNDNGLTASVEVPQMAFGNLTPSVRTHATGALALQRDYLFTGLSDAFNSASTLGEGATAGLTLKGCGTNATCAAEAGLYHGASAPTGTPAATYIIDIAADTNGTNNYVARLLGEVLSGGATPGIAAGPGTGGTSPTIVGANSGGVITVTTGATPTSDIIATVTYLYPFPNGSSVVLYPANAATASLNGTSMTYATPGTSKFTITAGSVALTGLTTYSWNYHVIGY